MPKNTSLLKERKTGAVLRKPPSGVAMIQPDEAIVATLSQQLGWSHVRVLLPIKDPLARDFYAEKAPDRVEEGMNTAGSNLPVVTLRVTL